MLDRILMIIPVWLLLDLYFFQVLKSAAGGCSPPLRRSIYGFYWIYDMALIVALFYLKLSGSGIFSGFFFLLVGPMMLSILPKLLILPFLLVVDFARLGSYLAGNRKHPALPGRRKFINKALLSMSALPFGYVLFGITRGAYHYKVYRNTLYFEELPDAFDGFTITQLSDMHCGSFNDADAVKRGIDLANAQNSDLLVLTGDLVNNEAAELNPWKGIFSSLKAPFGVYSVLGNHDYGDYMDWSSEAAKEANLNELKKIQSEMGFRLLVDEHVKLEKDGQHINLAGVQNWGRRFRQYGDLDKAMEQVNEGTFSILLSHDPSHWEARVLSHAKPVYLTLAGHTHGMQFGIDIPWLKWSPAKYIYKQWAGIYQKGSRYINVNRGFGFLGFSGRVGIWPEISVITLKKGASPGRA
ncbi:metallophosphoesterase [Anseongella ginsenosidimutans]|nr:metallophosphoesterase [Anseongella ginsenosidimutans]QEC53081.1 metallophosphoesterase [Anseongella ginsenosidimutans]